MSLYAKLNLLNTSFQPIMSKFTIKMQYLYTLFFLLYVNVYQNKKACVHALHVIESSHNKYPRFQVNIHEIHKKIKRVKMHSHVFTHIQVNQTA